MPPLNPFNDPGDRFGGGGYQPLQPGRYPQTQQELDAQIAWIAAINGQTPQEYLETQAAINANGGQPPLTPYQEWYGQQTAPDAVPRSIWGAQQAEDVFVQQETDRLNAYNQGLGNLWTRQDGLEQRAVDRAAFVGQQNAGLNAVNWGAVNAANAGNTAALGAYGQAVSNAGAWDMQNFQNLQAAANAPMIMRASPYVGDAMSNPADVARQTQVFNQLQGAASGSLDVQSQAARAYANAQDVANQQRAAATLEASGNGALNVDLNSIRELDKLRDPDSIGGVRDLYGVFQGSQDLAVGQLDPDAYKAAVDTRTKLWGLTDPTVTAQEKLMFELSRQQQEQDEGALRDALRTDSQRRGMGGVGNEIARSALGAQQTSRNRMLQDMQALAQAQARSMDALANHGNLSSEMNAQANQLAMQNQATRVRALEGYTNVHAGAASTLGQIGAANATANANRQLQAQAYAYQAYAELRAQGFSEEYARGQAADMVNSANMDRRLGAMNASGNLATNMRNASDAMNMFNQGQRQQQSQFADMFQANREDAAYGRQRDVWTAGNTVGRNYMQDQGDLFRGTFDVNQTNFGNTQTGIGTQVGLTDNWLGYQERADGMAERGIQTRAGILGQQNTNLSRRNSLPVINGRQKVADATTIRGIGIQNRADAEQTAAQGGGYPTSYPVVHGGGVPGGGSRTLPSYPSQNPYDPYESPYYNPWNGGTPI